MGLEIMYGREGIYLWMSTDFVMEIGVRARANRRDTMPAH